MTDFGINFRSSDDYALVRDRVAAARARAREAAERYVQIRRRAEAVRTEAAETRTEAREVRAKTAAFRETLRDSVKAYVHALRRTNTPPERAIVLVKTAVVESDSYPDKYHRQVVEEVVRWAVDAYYAA